MDDRDIPIHSCSGTVRVAYVHRKTGLYASEQVCTIYGVGPNVSALELATMLCEALEARRERAGR